MWLFKEDACFRRLIALFLTTGFVLVMYETRARRLLHHRQMTEKAIQREPNTTEVAGQVGTSPVTMHEAATGFPSPLNDLIAFGSGVVYSAFYDARASTPLVRVIGIIPKDMEVVCSLKNTVTGKKEAVKATIEEIHVRRADRPLRTSFLRCKIKDREFIPNRVTLVKVPADTRASVTSLAVTNIHSAKVQYQFAVCLHQPLFNADENVAKRIIEWIAVNRVFGGEVFAIYSMPSSHKAYKILEPFVYSGLVDLRPWSFTLPIDDVEDQQGQKVVINDCLYRFMNRAKHVVLVDFDEIITPQKHSTWSSMITGSDCSTYPSVSVRNAFFPLQSNATLTRNARKFNLTVLQKTDRRNDLFTCHFRSKLIVDPKHIISSSTHHVYKHLKVTEKTCCLDPEISLNHHYRQIPDREFRLRCCVQNERMLDFADEIVKSALDVDALLNKSRGGR